MSDMSIAVLPYDANKSIPPFFILGKKRIFTCISVENQQEVRKSGTYKSQLEMYKRQVQELQMKTSEETKRADKAEFEGKRAQEKMSSLQREKEVRLFATEMVINKVSITNFLQSDILHFVSRCNLIVLFLKYTERLITWQQLPELSLKCLNLPDTDE